jgi:hypothetical protein
LGLRLVELFLRLKKRTLDNMRGVGVGNDPNFRKHSDRVHSHMDELKEWSLESRTKSTLVLSF